MQRKRRNDDEHETENKKKEKLTAEDHSRAKLQLDDNGSERYQLLVEENRLLQGKVKLLEQEVKILRAQLGVVDKKVEVKEEEIHLLDLPLELISQILSYLNATFHFYVLPYLCKKIYHLLDNPQSWCPVYKDERLPKGLCRKMIEKLSFQEFHYSWGTLFMENKRVEIKGPVQKLLFMGFVNNIILQDLTQYKSTLQTLNIWNYQGNEVQFPPLTNLRELTFSIALRVPDICDKLHRFILSLPYLEKLNLQVDLVDTINEEEMKNIAKAIVQKKLHTLILSNFQPSRDFIEMIAQSSTITSFEWLGTVDCTADHFQPLKDLKTMKSLYIACPNLVGRLLDGFPPLETFAFHGNTQKINFSLQTALKRLEIPLLTLDRDSFSTLLIELYIDSLIDSSYSANPLYVRCFEETKFLSKRVEITRKVGMREIQKYVPQPVKTLHCWGITDEDLQFICSTFDLEILTIDSENITNNGLKYIKNLKSLKKLSFSGECTLINGIGIASQLEGVRLEELEIEAMMNRSQVAELMKLDYVERVRLESSEGLMELARKAGKDWSETG